MADRKSLPFILDLLDDDSDVVRAELTKALMAYGEALPGLLAELSHTPSPAKKRIIRELLVPTRHSILINEWNAWNTLPTGKHKLELGLDIISRYMGYPFRNTTLSSEFDRLANSAITEFPTLNERELAVHLFSTLGFSGNRTRYYDPANSDILAVIEFKAGLPITLACLLILVGNRLGLTIEGSHVPGHFLARVASETGHLYVDCFNSGRWLPESALREAPFNLTDEAIALARLPADAESILARILRNLIVAYTRQEDVANQQIFATLLSTLQEHEPNRPLMNAAFIPGDLVRHKGGQYRGVVVEADPICKADDTWYYTNGNQPDRNQAWYHILVDGSSSATYVAQSELEADPKGSSITHPLLPYFFGDFTQGHYIRNERPWASE